MIWKMDGVLDVPSERTRVERDAYLALLMKRGCPIEVTNLWSPSGIDGFSNFEATSRELDDAEMADLSADSVRFKETFLAMVSPHLRLA